MTANAVKHMMKCNARGTVIVPEWPSASFWPLLSPNLGFLKKFLTAHLILPKDQKLCVPGRGQCIAYKPGKRLFDNHVPFNLIAMRFDFSEV